MRINESHFLRSCETSLGLAFWAFGRYCNARPEVGRLENARSSRRRKHRGLTRYYDGEATEIGIRYQRVYLARVRRRSKMTTNSSYDVMKRTMAHRAIAEDELSPSSASDLSVITMHVLRPHWSRTAPPLSLPKRFSYGQGHCSIPPHLSSRTLRVLKILDRRI